mgnify:CR=1 FL=1
MTARFGLKFVECLFYLLAALAALPLFWPDLNYPLSLTDFGAITFIMIGTGILLPRGIAYRRWRRVIANVGPYRETWDGESSTTYFYEVDNQKYGRSFRTTYDSVRLTHIEICLNPSDPRIVYPVFWNLWIAGAGILALGLFLFLSPQDYFG